MEQHPYLLRLETVTMQSNHFWLTLRLGVGRFRQQRRNLDHVQALDQMREETYKMKQK